MNNNIIVLMYILAFSLIFFLVRHIFTSKNMPQKSIKNISTNKLKLKSKLIKKEITLSIYPKSSFQSYNLKNLYEKIVIDLKWYDDEPFHNSFANILFFLDRHNLWIKSLNTKNLNLKVRKTDGGFDVGNSFKVLSTNKILEKVLIYIVEILKQKLEKRDAQAVTLATVIYIFSNSNNVKYKTINQDELIVYLINTFLDKSMDKELVKYIALDIKLNSKIDGLEFVNTKYQEALKISNEYAHFIDEHKTFNIELLKDTPKKKLFSLKQEQLFVY